MRKYALEKLIDVAPLPVSMVNDFNDRKVSSFLLSIELLLVYLFN